MHSVCVFLGSAPGRRPSYAAAAVALGSALARNGLRLVYGGSNVGLMKLLADAALGAGGEVVGILPGALQARELAHPGLTRLEEEGFLRSRDRALLQRGTDPESLLAELSRRVRPAEPIDLSRT